MTSTKNSQELPMAILNEPRLAATSGCRLASCIGGGGGRFSLGGALLELITLAVSVSLPLPPDLWSLSLCLSLPPEALLPVIKIKNMEFDYNCGGSPYSIPT